MSGMLIAVPPRVHEFSRDILILEHPRYRSSHIPVLVGSSLTANGQSRSQGSSARPQLSFLFVNVIWARGTRYTFYLKWYVL